MSYVRLMKVKIRQYHLKIPARRRDLEAQQSQIFEQPDSECYTPRMRIPTNGVDSLAKITNIVK
jgi:hypothetical protein